MSTRLPTQLLWLMGLTSAAFSQAFAAEDTSSWHPLGDRPIPSLSRLNGSAGEWYAYLAGAGLYPLNATATGRSYRWIHDGGSGQGFIELDIDDHGAGMLQTSEVRKVKFIRPAETAAFEKELESSGFATMKEDYDGSGLDDCQDNVFEAVVNRRYHVVQRGCGYPRELDASIKLLQEFAKDTTPTGSPPDFLWIVPAKKSDESPSSKNGQPHQ